MFVSVTGRRSPCTSLPVSSGRPGSPPRPSTPSRPAATTRLTWRGGSCSWWPSTRTSTWRPTWWPGTATSTTPPTSGTGCRGRWREPGTNTRLSSYSATPRPECSSETGARQGPTGSNTATTSGVTLSLYVYVSAWKTTFSDNADLQFPQSVPLILAF